MKTPTTLAPMDNPITEGRMRIEVYIDHYGRIGVLERFEDTEENCGLNELLDELVAEDFYGDTYAEHKGVCTAIMELEHGFGEDGTFMQIAKIEPSSKTTTDGEITPKDVNIAAYDFNDTYEEEKIGHYNLNAFREGAWWAIDTMKGIK